MQNSPARSVIDVGTVIDGTYTIEGLIGRGGMGAVFLARHNRLAGKKVAIKMLHADLGGDNAEILTRFKREADIASQLEHPNIVKVYDYKLLDDGTPYIVYEFLEGESLAQREKAGAMTVEHTLSIMRQVGSALAAAHRAGIVHRDLKPQNIFLVPSETDGRASELAKVLDFGISKMRGSTTVKTQDSSLLGTPQYMAPEQATGQHSAVDERTDIFALGVIMYEMLSGKAPFDGASIPEVVFKVVYEQPVPLAQLAPKVPRPIVEAVERAMAKQQSERFATVSDLVEALTGSALTSGIRRPTTSVPPPERHSKESDAFANTMGSGDHGGSAAVPVATPPPVRGSSPTVESQSRAPETEPSLRTQPSAEVKRSRTPLVLGLAIGALAIGGLITFVAMRGETKERVATTEPREHHAQPEHRSAPPKPEPPKPEPPKPAPPTPPPPSPAPPAPAPVVKTEAPKLPAQKPPDKTDKPAAVKEPAETGDDGIKEKLRDAEAALHDKNTERAEQLANGIVASDVASTAQKAHAHVIHGIVACSAHNNDEVARIDLRALDGFPRMRKRLIAACQKEGHLQTE